MRLVALLSFVPLVIGVILAYNLIVKQSLPSKKLGEVLTYFLGVLIVFGAISWLITTFLAGWATNLLQAGTQNNQWQQFINESQTVVENAFSANQSAPGPVVQPTLVVQPQIVTATPTSSGGGSALNVVPGTGTTYTVKANDTLFAISTQYNISLDALMKANNLTNYIIQPGQVLIIPAPGQ